MLLCAFHTNSAFNVSCMWIQFSWRCVFVFIVGQKMSNAGFWNQIVHCIAPCLVLVILCCVLKYLPMLVLVFGWALITHTHTKAPIINKSVEGKFGRWWVGLWNRWWSWLHGCIFYLIYQIIKLDSLITYSFLYVKKDQTGLFYSKWNSYFFLNSKNSDGCFKFTDQCVLLAAEIGKMWCVSLNRYIRIFSLCSSQVGHSCNTK